MLHETLHAAIDQANQDLVDFKCVLTDPLAIAKHYQYDGISYDTYKKFDGELATYKGRKTKKWFHVTITRMESGRYEVVSYPL